MHLNKKSYRCIFISFIGSLMLATMIAAGNAAAATNLIANPSFETATATGSPQGWTAAKSGINNAAFSYVTGGAQSGTKSVKVTITTYTNGDSRWFFNPVTITGGKTYYFTNYYKATVATKTYVEFQNSTGTKTVKLLGTNALKTIWTKSAYRFTAPADAVKATLYQVMAARGTMQNDSYSLIQIPDPTVTANVPNYSLEEVDSRTNNPLDWINERSGTNAATFTYATGTGHTGTRSVKTTISSYTNGYVRWYFTPQTITGGKCYTFSDWYKSSIASQVSVIAYNSANTATIINLADAPASATAWKQYSADTCLPADTVKYTVYHAISRIGNLTLDDFSFTEKAGGGTIIVKNITSGGDATFSFTATGTGYQNFALSNGQQNSQTLTAGTYSVTETILNNWTSDGGKCDNRQTPGNIVLAAGQTVTCTFTNTYAPATAKLKVQITSTGGGKFDILVDGITQLTGISNGNLSSTVSTGTHTVSQIAAPGTNASNHKTVFSGDCDACGTIILEKDEEKTCVITNTYSPSSSTELMPNPSLEDINASSTVPMPLHWSSGGWGTNTPTYTYDTDAHRGTHSAKVEITAYTDGDAKWYSDPIPVTAGKRYLVGDYYKSNIQTQISVEFNLSNGTKTYPELGIAAASTNDWVRFAGLITAPTGAVSMTVFHFINKVGWLTTDDYSVTEAATITGYPANGSLEIASPSDPANFPDLWAHSKWGTNTATFAYRRDESHSGSSSVAINMTEYTDGDAKWYFDPPIAVNPGESYIISDWYKSTASTHVIVAYTNTNGSIRYNELRMAPASPTAWANFSEIVQIPINAKTMTVYHAIKSVGTLATDDYSIVKTAPIGFNQPIISLTFDDSWEKNALTAVPIMGAYGFKATNYFATTYLAGTPSNGNIGEDGPATVKYFHNQGHEIGSHSITHPWLTRVNSTTLANELNQSKAVLEGLVGAGNVKSFATPYGDYNKTVLSAIDTYYASHRTVDEGYNLKNNYDVSRIKVQNMKKTTTQAEFQSWIDQAVKDKSWLVIVYHRVFTATADDPLDDYDTPLADLTPQMEAIKSAVANYGVTVLPISRAIAVTSPQI